MQKRLACCLIAAQLVFGLSGCARMDDGVVTDKPEVTAKVSESPKPVPTASVNNSPMPESSAMPTSGA